MFHWYSRCKRFSLSPPHYFLLTNLGIYLIQLAFALLPKIKKVVTLELEPYLKNFNEPYWKRAGVSSKINMMIGPAVKSLYTLAEKGEQFSLVFIDANKTGYLEYVQLILELNLLEEGGIILADNTLYKVSSGAS